MSEVQGTTWLNKSGLISYLKEVRYLKLYVISVILFVTLSFSVYLFFDIETVIKLGSENNVFELLTVIFFLSASFLFFKEWSKTRNIFLIILAVAMFVGAGEELSWGQTIFKWKTPEAIEKLNVQDETNIHNLIFVNSRDFNGNWKKGIQRIFEINFMFKVFVTAFGIILPFCVFHIKPISRLALKLKIPVPPISIGLFFLLSYQLHHYIRVDFVSSNAPPLYRDSAIEIYECTEAFILFIIALYFYRKHKIMTIGKDVKQLI